MRVAFRDRARIPHDRCYACYAHAVGVRDRRPEGHDMEAACARHADPTIAATFACVMCDGPLRAGSVDQGDGLIVHASCLRGRP